MEETAKTEGKKQSKKAVAAPAGVRGVPGGGPCGVGVAGTGVAGAPCTSTSIEPSLGQKRAASE